MNINHLVFQPLKNEVLDKKNYLIQSLTLHLVVIFLLYYGFPNLFKYRSEFLPPLPVEIINISHKTAAPEVNFKKTKEEETKNPGSGGLCQTGTSRRTVNVRSIVCGFLFGTCARI